MLVHHYVLGMKLRGARHTTRIHFCLTMMALDTIHSFSGHSEYILLIGKAVCLLVTGGEENGLKLCLAKAMRNLEMRLNPFSPRVGCSICVVLISKPVFQPRTRWTTPVVFRSR